MPSEADLLAAIDVAPDDDAPRLAHADWLEKNGDPERAEYIRLAIQHARVPWGGMERDLEKRHAANLLAVNRKRWLGARPEASTMHWTFTRGYPEEITYTAITAFDATWKTALSFPVRRVTFTDLRDPRGLASRPGLSRIRVLGLNCYSITDAILLDILTSPHLDELEGLIVARARLGERILHQIADSDKFSRVRELSFNGVLREGAPRHAWATLAKSPHLAQLRRLNLTSSRMSPEAAELLLSSPHLGNLRSLNLSHNSIGPGPLAGIGPRLPALEELDLDANGLNDAGAEAVAAAARSMRLRRLDLMRNLIGGPGAAALAGIAGLERLGLANNAIPDVGADALATSPHMRSVISLTLNSNLIGDDGMMALGRSANLSNVVDFAAGGNLARPHIHKAVNARFQNRQPPLTEELPGPAPAPAVQSAASEPVGQADEDGLVRAILADPSDELARNVYADWLEENGRPLHAELLRSTTDAPRRVEVMRLIGIPVAAALPGCGMTDEGGLVSVSIPLRKFLTKAFQAMAPAWLRGNHIACVRLDGHTKDWSRVANAPASAHLRALLLCGCRLQMQGAEAFAAASTLCSLASLDLDDAGLPSAGVEVLVKSGRLGGLVHLDLGHNLLRADAVHALADGPLAGRLRHLGLQYCRMTDAGAGVLARSEKLLSGLSALNLRGNGLGDRAVQALVTSPHADRLHVLNLYRNSITEAGVRLLAESDLLRRLRWLAVSLPHEGNGEGEVCKEFLRAVVGVPGLTLVLNQYTSKDLVEAFRDELGARLVLV